MSRRRSYVRFGYTYRLDPEQGYVGGAEWDGPFPSKDVAIREARSFREHCRSAGVVIISLGVVRENLRTGEDEEVLKIV